MSKLWTTFVASIALAVSSLGQATPLPEEVLRLLQSGKGDRFHQGDANYGAGFKQIGFKVEKHPELQKLIDRLTERFLATKSAHKRIGPILSDPVYVQRVFATSPEASRRIFNTYRASMGRSFKKAKLRFFDDEMWEIEKQYGLPSRYDEPVKRTLTLVYGERPMPVFEAYSDGSGSSILLLDPTSLTEERVLAMLIHEAGITLDSHGYNIYDSEDGPYETWLWAWEFRRNDIVEMALDATKAFRFEHEVFAELPELDQSLTGTPRVGKFDESECHALIEKTTEALKGMTTNRDVKRDAKKKIKELKANRRCLELTDVQLFDGGSICFSKGPKPRVGGD